MILNWQEVKGAYDVGIDYAGRMVVNMDLSGPAHLAAAVP